PPPARSISYAEYPRSPPAPATARQTLTPAGAFRQLAAHMPEIPRADLALALVTLWLGRLCGRMDYAAGFIFMRRMGSAALTATGPVLNVLPLAVNLHATEDLPTLAKRLAAQLK
ncbi:condensation domain-containing protein, partial [Salmonella enterica]|uniref:condensation domain-containing protein n=1 Tax=Salmonella enterica TaxID=28901 RepID=UPI00174D69A6